MRGRKQFIEHQWSRVPPQPFVLGNEHLKWVQAEPGLLDHLIALSADAERAARADRVFFTAMRDGTIRNCAECGASFTPARADARYCSSACRQKAYRGRARAT